VAEVNAPIEFPPVRPQPDHVVIKVKYALFLPGGACWVFNHLDYRGPGSQVRFPNTNSMYWEPDTVYIPIDLITAAQLRLIEPGDDSGLGEEQWAWLKLIGLVGGSDG
jgi:hypothetical protein